MSATPDDVKKVQFRHKVTLELHPSEHRLIKYMRELDYGSFRIKVQHGLPEVADVVRQKVKFNE